MVYEIKDKIISFVKRAGTTILLASIIIWFLLSFSIKLEFGVQIEKSILALIGKKISWIFYPMLGVKSWEASVSIIQGLIAKEQVISSMSIISGLKQNTLKQGIFSLGTGFEFFNKPSSYAFMVFNLFSAPCLATIATIRKEIGSIIKTSLIIAYYITVAWIISILIYRFGLLIF